VIGSGRAASSISNANIAAEHGVLGASDNAQQRIDASLAASGQALPAAASTASGQLSGLLNNQTQNLQPAITAGQSGVEQLQKYAASNPQFSFDPSKFINSQAEQYEMQQGQQAVQNASSVTGTGLSGNSLKALTQLGQGLGATYYNQAEQQAQNEFALNQNTTLANLSALTGAGLTATGQQNTANASLGVPAAEIPVNTATNLASLNLGGQEVAGKEALGAAQTAGDFAVGAGTAHSTGILGTYKNLGNLGADVGTLATGLFPAGG